MDINKGLSFFYGDAPTGTAKVLDLGFNGDFDYKNHCWNNVFVSFAPTASGTDMTVKFYAKQADVPSTADDSTDVIATLVIPAAKVQAGGAYAFPMPTGLKRYVTVAISGSTLPSKVFCGITNDVDTDAIALGGGIDWTNYEAATFGTKLTDTPMQHVAELIGEGIGGVASGIAEDIAEDVAGDLMDEHEAKGKGEVEGLAHVQNAG